jgi:hypothetical protein
MRYVVRRAAESPLGIGIGIEALAEFFDTDTDQHGSWS